ncbi:hypothetical protein Tco_1228419 [Tanacetum coccineum]
MADDDQDMEMCDDTEFLERVVQATEAAVSTQQQQQLFRPPPPITHEENYKAVELEKKKPQKEIEIEKAKGFVVLHYSNSKGKAYGPLPDPPSDGNDNSYAVNQAMSIRYSGNDETPNRRERLEKTSPSNVKRVWLKKNKQTNANLNKGPRIGEYVWKDVTMLKATLLETRAKLLLTGGLF